MEDPRTTYRGNLQHLLTDMIFLVISAVVSGANTWKDIEIFGNGQLQWLRKFVPLKEGVPSHDTLGRVFSVLDYDKFSEYFIEWVNEISFLSKGEVIAIDGKRLRGSYDKTSSKKAIHMVSAFASQNGLCLGQKTCDDKSNEITAIPELLDLIAIKGCPITIDAMGCQTKIAKKIRDKEADYILAVKENQKELYQQVEKLFSRNNPASTYTDTDTGHGRIETRKCSVIDNLKFFDVEQNWVDLKSIIKIESERYIKIEDKTQRETRFYISSLNEDAKLLNSKIRSHWAIENNLHWMLDVEFGEDKSRKREGNSAKNFNLISKVALALIKKEDTKRISQRGKRYRAALDSDFREKILRI